ncbi:MAG: hypothetical protein ACP5SH_25935 [Syntrophobacteraceae bacterium]
MGGRRLEQYRVFAAKAAATYDTVILKKLDLRRSAKNGGARRLATGGSDRRNFLNIASLSILKGEIRRAFDVAGKLVVEKDCSERSETCPFCGEATENGHAKILLSCSKCGNFYDPDMVGANDLLSNEVSTLNRA